MFKRELKKEISKRNGISFKTATMIVVGFHILGFVGLTQWSSYKTKISREARASENKKRMESANNAEVKWPTSNVTPKILAIAPTPKPIQKIEKISSNSWWHSVASMLNNNPAQSTGTVTRSDQKISANNKNSNQESEKTTKHALQQLQDATKELERVKKELAITKRARSAPTSASSTKTVASSEVTIKNGKVVSSRQSYEIAPPTTKIEVRPDNSSTYSSNGFNYVNIDRLMSSHIKLD